jgi:inosine-uridine nucleoside N-ribohydrolase
VPAKDPIPVIIDTDPGVDDALALLLAGASPEIRVLAVTTVGGNVSLERATDNARRILPLAWEVPPPLYRGRSRRAGTAESVHGTDGLSGATLMRSPAGALRYPPLVDPAAAEAPEAILRLVERHPGEITLITLGPLTNVAAALELEPGALRKLRRVVVMGGALREPGNVTPVAEFNIWADPEAAQQVCDSGLPQTWVSVDVTHRCLMRLEHMEALPESRRGRFIRDVSRAYMHFHFRGYQEYACFLHDPLAVGAVVWPELLTTVPKRIDVEAQGRLTRGMTVVDFRPTGYDREPPPNAEICVGVEANEFVRRFIERLA